jgi:hypothetical protein
MGDAHRHGDGGNRQAGGNFLGKLGRPVTGQREQPGRAYLDEVA